MFMLRISLLLGSIFLCSYSNAISPPAEIKYSVYSKDYPSEQFSGPVNTTEHSRQVLSPGKRDNLFLKAGIAPITSKWSHYKKDMLLLKALNFTKQKLAKEYPQIPKEKLEALQKIAKASVL